MRKIIEADYNQIFLLPPSLEEMVPADHPARFIREFVDAMEIQELELKAIAEVGGKVFSPRLLLCVWLYGYFKKIRSCRAMETLANEDIPTVWLSGKTQPDHNTLWRFWRDNKRAIGNFFKATVKVAIKSDLVDFALQAVDGTKIQARVSGRRGYSLEQNQELLAAVDRAIRDQERGIESTISRDANTPRIKLPKTLLGKEALANKIRGAMDQMQQEERKYCHPSEPDARRLKLDERNRFGHNAQAVVNAKKQIITGADVIPSESDSGHLLEMMENSKEQTGADPTTLADGSYGNSGETIRVAQEQGLDVVTPLPSSSANKDNNAYHTCNFRYEKEGDVVICPQGKELGFMRERTDRGTKTRVYRSSGVCRGCPVRALCTKSAHGRSIELSVNSEAIERHRKKMEEPSVRALYKLRSQIVEPVFAHIKEHGGFRRWTVCGLTNVRAQWLLLCATWNLGRLYKEWKNQKNQRSGPQSAPAGAGEAVAGLLCDLVALFMWLAGIVGGQIRPNPVAG